MSKIVIFSLGQEKYGVLIHQVREIIPCSQIAPVPGTPDYFEGFMNVRGELISIINLRTFIEMEEIAEKEESRILILSSRKGTIQGILVDEVTSIKEIEWDQLQNVEENRNNKGFPREFLKGVINTDSGLVLVLDVERMFSEEKEEKEEKEDRKILQN
jgi:purine-binding chemotaxis protein CheW